MKDKTIAYLLWAGAAVGLAGLHRLYMGKYVTGILWLCTWGLAGVGQLIDAFLIPGMVEDTNNRLLVRQMAVNALPSGRRMIPRTTEELQVALVQAAEGNGGTLTVAEAVAATGRGFKDIERQLNAMAVEGYIEPDTDDSGALLFRFPGLS